jgi:hypothetical protein
VLYLSFRLDRKGEYQDRQCKTNDNTSEAPMEGSNSLVQFLRALRKKGVPGTT